ncbi:ribosomal protein L6e-domain-containing protein [Lipomyces kononenkoae]|uniref:Ribosomal protein L6e-domain-containing protein n=1 Tax=Lipomyces kononenkoae TaxID=34357 RepID=A0ACC3SWE3_LIPKO
MSAVTKEIGGPSNGGKRVIPANKASKWYPAEDIPALKKARKTARPAVLRASLTPGAVLIILAGRFRGKRVVLLKALEDGTLLVTGPFKVNGVPLRRVNPAYVIATSTVVPVESVDVSAFSVAYFAHEKKSKKEGEAEFFGDEEKKQKKVISEVRIADQKAVDTALLAEIKKVPALKAYLSSSFSLKKGDKPHLMKF